MRDSVIIWFSKENKMAEPIVRDLWDPTYMTSTKNGHERKVFFTDCLINSLTMKEWIEHEKRVSDLIVLLRNLDADFQDLHAQDPTVWVDVGKFFLTYSTSKDNLRKEFEMYLPMLKEKFQGSRKEILYKLEYELESYFENWSKKSSFLVSVSRLPSRLKNENDLMKYMKLCDQFFDAKRIIEAEKMTISKLIEQGARSSHVKLAI